MPTRLMTIPLALVLVLTLASCGNAPPPPAEKPAISGEVTAISYGGDEESAVEGVLGTLLVEETADPPTGVGKANVTVTDATVVSRRDGEDLVDAEFEDIVEGDIVDVWFDGPVAESFPVQAKAKTIVIAP